jgi:RNA polymerase sigma-70 factor (ECF subfamily)
MRRAIERVLAQLPERSRTAFELSRVQGLSYREIAEVMGVSLKTVETQMWRTLKRIRRQMAPFLGVVAGIIALGKGWG